MFLKKIINQFSGVTNTFFILFTCSLLLVSCASTKQETFSTKYHNFYSNNPISLANDKERFFDMLIHASNELSKTDLTLNFNSLYHEEIDLSPISDAYLSKRNEDWWFRDFRGLVTSQNYVENNQEMMNIMQAAAKNLSFCNAAQIITKLIYDSVISLENNCTPLSSLTDEFNRLNKDEQDFILNAAILAYYRSASMMCRTFQREYYEYPNRKTKYLPNYFSRYIKDNSEYKSTTRYAQWDPYTYLPFAIIQMYHSKSYQEGKNESLYFDPDSSAFIRTFNDSTKTKFQNNISEAIIFDQSHRIIDWAKKKIYYDVNKQLSKSMSYWYYDRGEKILSFSLDDENSLHASSLMADLYTSREQVREAFNGPTELSGRVLREHRNSEISLFVLLYHINDNNSFITNVFGDTRHVFASFGRQTSAAQYNNRRKISMLNYERLWAETSILAGYFLANNVVNDYKQSTENLDYAEIRAIADEVFNTYLKYSIHFANQYGNWDLDYCENRLPSDQMVASLAFKQFYSTILPNSEYTEKLEILHDMFNNSWDAQVGYKNRSARGTMNIKLESARELQSITEDAIMQRRYEDQKFKEEQRRANYSNILNTLNYINQNNQQRNSRIATNNTRITGVTRSSTENTISNNNQTSGRNNNIDQQTNVNEPNIQSTGADINCEERQFNLPNHLRRGEFKSTTRLVHPSDTWSYKYLRTEQDDNCGNSTLVFEASINNPDSWKNIKGLKAGHTVYYSKDFIKNELIPGFGNIARRFIRGHINDEFNPAPGVGSRSNYSFKPSSGYEIVDMNLYERENDNSTNEGGNYQINQGQGHFYVTDLRMKVKVNVNWQK